MEFIKVLTEMFEKNNLNEIKDPNKLINTFVLAVKTEDDSIKFHQLNYLLGLPKVGNFIYKIYQTHTKKQNVSNTISELVNDFSSLEISPSVYSYFIYCTLKALKIQTEEMNWISPSINTLRNSSIGMDPSFGYGVFVEDVYDYEVARGVVVKALRDRKYMTIPNRVTHIDENAFRHLQLVEFLTLPQTVTTLTPNNFSEAPELGRIILSSEVKSIPSNFLKNAHKLFVVVARGVTEVGANCFEATRLTSVKNIGSGNLQYIGDQAFKDCFQLKKLEFNNLKKIGAAPFYNCINSAEIIITINESLINNKFQIFKLFETDSKDMSNYTYLKNITVEAKDGIIPEGFFEGCTTVTNIKVIGDVHTIGANAFKGCTSLENLEIEFKGSKIEDSVFEDCSRLVFFPKFVNVEELGANAFKGCATVDDLIFYKPITKLNIGSFQDCIALKKLTIRLITDRLPAYCFSGCVSLLDFTFTNNIKHIESFALHGIELPINFTLPAKINSIAKNAFDNCTFTNIVLPNECNIDEGAFSNIKPIKKLIINNLNILDLNGNKVELYKLFEEEFTVFNTKFNGLKSITIDTDIIPQNSFKDWVNLEVAQLSENITTIEASSFEGCSSLQSIYIESCDLVIKEAAFKNCVNLVRIRTINNELPDTRGVYDLSVCTFIEKDAFFNCNIDELFLTITAETKQNAFLLGEIFKKEINSDNLLRYINVDCTDGVLVKQLFENCSTVKNIKITGTVTQLEDHLFSGCSSLENLEVEYEGNEITSHCFANCKKLVKFPNFANVKIISDYAFYGCTSLPAAKFTKRIDVIGTSAFENCANLKEIDMEFYGETLKTDTFKGCSLLNNFHFIKSIEVLETNSLSNINLVNKFILPDSVKVIKSNAFNGSTLGAELVLNPNITYEAESFNNVKGINKLVFNSLNFTDGEKIVLPHEIFSKNLDNFNKKFEAIKSIDVNTNNICDNAFKGWKNLSKIIFTHKVESLSNSCFEDCVGIEKITLPYFNMSLGTKSFANCTNLSKVAFENNYLETPNIELVPKKVFNNCKKIEEIYIYLNQTVLDNKLTLVNYFADNEDLFNKNLTKLKTVVIVNETQEIPANFFKNCRRITNVKILNKVETFNKNSFENCTLLENVEANFIGNLLPNNLFKDCINLTTFFNYDSVDTIGDSVFSNCKKIEMLNFSKEILSIGKNSFENCVSLTDINMKYSGEKIGKEAFLNCKKLIRTPKFINLETLDETTFSGCKELRFLSLTALKNTNMNKLFSGLKSIDKVYYNSIDIPNGFFKDVTNVNEIVFEQKLKTIGDQAFENCTTISTISNLEELEYLGDNV
ncbi:MAG: leucine-rich repeat protein, partial [bacterium]